MTNLVPRIFALASLIFVVLLLFSTAAVVGNNSRSASEFITEAKRLIAQGQNNEALQSLEAAVNVNEKDYLIRFKRALLLIGMGRNHNALQDLNQVISQKPDFDQALMQRAKIHLRQCELVQAIVDLESLHSRKSGGADVENMLQESKEARDSYAQAKNLLQSANVNYAQVSELLNKVSKVCSQDGQLRMLKAEVLEKNGDIELAIGEYTRASMLQADNMRAFIKLSELHLKLGEIEQALHNIKGCLHLDPEHRVCAKQFKKLKKITKSMGRAEDAIKRHRYKEALGSDALNPDESSGTKASGVIPLLNEMDIGGVIRKKAVNMVCDSFVKLKKSDDALKWCAKAASLPDNDEVEMLCNLGEAQIMKEEYEDAVQTFGKAQQVPGGQQANCVREGAGKAQRLLRQSKKKDYYKILGVSRDATDREIKKGFRKLAMEYHPDKYTGNKEIGEKKMAEINQAYEVLSNEELRRRYDAGDDPNDPTGGHDHHGGGGFPFGGGQPVFFHQGGGGGDSQGFHFQFGF